MVRERTLVLGTFSACGMRQRKTFVVTKSLTPPVKHFIHFFISLSRSKSENNVEFEALIGTHPYLANPLFNKPTIFGGPIAMKRILHSYIFFSSWDEQFCYAYLNCCFRMISPDESNVLCNTEMDGVFNKIC